MIPDGRTPVFVVTGFLGSGKTTLLNRLIATPRFLDSLVVVNEFGEVPVDHHLLQSSEEKTVALPNGCLCCHLRGADLLRVKGIVALDGGEHVAVQGVRHVFDRLRPIANRPSTGLVFITQNMARHDVVALWQAMSSLKGSS